MFWIFLLGLAVVITYPWVGVLLGIIFVLIMIGNHPRNPQVRNQRPARVRRPAKVRPPARSQPAVVDMDPWAEMRRLQQLLRKYREYDHYTWDKEFNRLVKELESGP
jgi:hypothetical protein